MSKYGKQYRIKHIRADDKTNILCESLGMPIDDQLFRDKYKSQLWIRAAHQTHALRRIVKYLRVQLIVMYMDCNVSIFTIAL